MPQRYVYDEDSGGMVPIGESVDVGNQYLLQDELGPAPAQSARTLRDVSGRARNEGDFQNWYGDISRRTGLDPNSDNPEHFYDYRGAYDAGAEPDQTGHWPSEFKREGHPRMIVDGRNIKTGTRAEMRPFFTPETTLESTLDRRGLRGPIPTARPTGRWDTEMRPVEESPDTAYATNIPGTAERWRGQGKKPYFVDELNNEISTPEGGKIGGWTPPERQAELKKADARNKPPGPKPSKGQLSEMDEFNKFWGSHLAEHYGGEDPLKTNPADASEKAMAEARKKHEWKLFNRDLYGKEKDVDYAAIEKEITQAGKTAEEKAKWSRNIALREKQESFNWFKLNAKNEASEGKPKTRADVQAAQEYGRRTMADPGSVELTEEEKELMASGENVPLISRKLRPEKLVEINRVRSLSGLPPLEEKMTKGPQKEYRDWGLFRTGETQIPGQYEYPESQYQYGTSRNGRRVKRDINGRVSYAD